MTPLSLLAGRTINALIKITFQSVCYEVGIALSKREREREREREVLREESKSEMELK